MVLQQTNTNNQTKKFYLLPLAYENFRRTTLLVFEVFPLSAISPSSLKWALMVPLVLKMSTISLLLIAISFNAYMSNRIMIWQILSDMALNWILKKKIKSLKNLSNH